MEGHPPGFRARIVSARDVVAGFDRTVAAAESEAALAEIRRWLEAFGPRAHDVTLP